MLKAQGCKNQLIEFVLYFYSLFASLYNKRVDIFSLSNQCVTTMVTQRIDFLVFALCSVIF